MPSEGILLLGEVFEILLQVGFRGLLVPDDDLRRRQTDL